MDKSPTVIPIIDVIQSTGGDWALCKQNEMIDMMAFVFEDQTHSAFSRQIQKCLVLSHINHIHDSNSEENEDIALLKDDT